LKFKTGYIYERLDDEFWVYLYTSSHDDWFVGFNIAHRLDKKQVFVYGDRHDLSIAAIHPAGIRGLIKDEDMQLLKQQMTRAKSSKIKKTVVKEYFTTEGII